MRGQRDGDNRKTLRPPQLAASFNLLSSSQLVLSTLPVVSEIVMANVQADRSGMVGELFRKAVGQPRKPLLASELGQHLAGGAGPF